MTAAQDLETNRNGVVVISYMLGANGKQLDRKAAWKISMMSRVSCVSSATLAAILIEILLLDYLIDARF